MVLDIYGTPGAETGGAVTLPRRSSPPTNAGVFEAWMENKHEQTASQVHATVWTEHEL